MELALAETHHCVFLADGKVLFLGEFYLVAVDVDGSVDYFGGIDWCAVGAHTDVALIATVRAFLVLTHCPTC